MYLFARSARLGHGNVQKSLAWATGITEKVNQVTELDARLWTSVFSPGLATITWTAVVEGLGVLEASEAKLMAEESYLSLVDQGATYLSADAIDDVLLQIVHPDPDAPNSQAQYASVVQAVIAPGNSVRAVELGVEAAQRVKKITGRPTSFAAAVTGAYGGVEWISLYDTVEQLQQAQEALGADTAFAKFIDQEISKVFEHGATQRLARRII